MARFAFAPLTATAALAALTAWAPVSAEPWAGPAEPARRAMRETMDVRGSAHAVVLVGPGAVHAGHVVPVQYHAPPPPRREAVPTARRGMQWVPGHWQWRGQRYVWVVGYWVKVRPGYHYRAHRWSEHDGRWHAQPGGWDRDGDGVPNRHDRKPHNPYQR